MDWVSARDPRSAWSIECMFGTRVHRDVKEMSK
jgi:hypothetical protein